MKSRHLNTFLQFRLLFHESCCNQKPNNPSSKCYLFSIFSCEHGTLHLAVLVGWSVSWLLSRSHFWILRGILITAPAQPSATGFPCIRPCFLWRHFILFVPSIFRPSEDADDICERKKVGLFQVAAVHSTFLVDMRNFDSRHLSFKSDLNIYSGLFKTFIGFLVFPSIDNIYCKAFSVLWRHCHGNLQCHGYLTESIFCHFIILSLLGPLDDVIIFNFNARYYRVNIWLSNEVEFGLLPKPHFPPNNLKVRLWIMCDWWNNTFGQQPCQNKRQ